MRKEFSFRGSIYSRNGRYYWKVTDPTSGKRRTISLIPTGLKFPTKDKLVAQEIAQNKWNAWQSQSDSVDTISELIKMYNAEVSSMYPETSDRAYKISQALKLLYSIEHLAPHEFGPRILIKIRSKLMESNFTAQTVNTKIRFIINMFKWASTREIVSVMIPYGLEQIESIKSNDARVKKVRNRKPVPLCDVRKTLGYLHPILRAMVITQLYTGTRPSEMLRIKPCDIDTSDSVWIYTQDRHKTDYKDNARPRIIPLNSQVQNVLIPILATKNQDEYLFSPSDGREVWAQIRSDCRKTPKSCGNSRGKSNSDRPGKLSHNDCYDHSSYRTAIKRAVGRLNLDLQKRDGENFEPMQIWTPYQLRHAAATAINAVNDGDALGFTQALLGHKNRSTTEIYAKMGLEKAKRAAEILNQIEI